MKKILTLAALIAMGAPAMAADFTTVVVETTVARSADHIWSRVGDYCAIKDWLALPCEITAGKGEIGTIRKLALPAGPTDELMISKTKYSYGYSQPTSPAHYHGHMEVVPVSANSARIIYTLVYDQAAMGAPDAQATYRKGRMDRFTGAIAKMKEIAEKP